MMFTEVVHCSYFVAQLSQQHTTVQILHVGERFMAEQCIPTIPSRFYYNSAHPATERATMHK